MSDPLVNPTTGKPCKGRQAARVLAAIMLSAPLAEAIGERAPSLFADACQALAPFGLGTGTLAERLEVSEPDDAGLCHLLAALAAGMSEGSHGL